MLFHSWLLLLICLSVYCSSINRFDLFIYSCIFTARTSFRCKCKIYVSEAALSSVSQFPSPFQVGAIAGYIVDKSGVLSRKERQAGDASQLAETESYILSAVSQVDTHGCILKLLCLLEAEKASEEKLTEEEKLFVDFLSNKMPLFSQEANATALISEEQDPGRSHSEEECTALFSNCPVGGQLLRRLLGVVWGFGISSI